MCPWFFRKGRRSIEMSVLFWPCRTLFQQRLIPYLRHSFECPLFGRLACRPGLCDIPLPRRNGTILLSRGLDRSCCSPVRVLSSVGFQLPTAVQFRQRLWLLGHLSFSVACYSCLEFHK